MQKFVILILSVAIVVAACNKKSTPTASRSDMLRTGKWSVESGTITTKLGGGKDTVLDYLKFVPLCHKDDYLVFHSNNDAAVSSGSVKCNPGDPDSTTFKWGLTNSNNNLSLYNGFNFVYGVVDSVSPLWHFDTLDHVNFKLDTVHGVLDTLAGFYRSMVVLDTIWDNRFDSFALSNVNIYNAAIVNFSQSSFIINFSTYGYRPDTTSFHTGVNMQLGYPIDSPQRYVPDTAIYSIKFKNN